MQLAEHQFFKLFPEPQRRALQAAVTVREHRVPVVLFEEGDSGASMFLVLDGEVEISMLSATGKYQALAVMERDSFFGEFSAVDESPRSARAAVPRQATLAELPGAALLAALAASPVTTGQAFMSQMVQRIRSFQHRFFTDAIRTQKMLLVGELTNSILHDLKSPLSIVTGTTEVLKAKHRDLETQHLCELIAMQAKRVQDMCHEVLDFVRGSTTLVPKKVNLKDVFPYFSLLNGDYFRRQGVDLKIEAADIEVRADPDKLVRVLQNLTNNACQAMLFGGQIMVSARERGEWVEIVVADNGPGIPEDVRPHLFEPFVTAGRHGGTGLGTTIAKSLIESHGGTIAFDTSEAGTTFTIRLPKRLSLELA